MKGILIFLFCLFIINQPNQGVIAMSSDIVVLETSQGAIEIKLMPDFAPKACENFSKLIENCYYEMDTYEFPSKKIIGNWYKPNIHGLPRLFISELEDDKLSLTSQKILFKYILPHHKTPFSRPVKQSDWLPTCILLKDYNYLLNESPYAAWTLLHGNLINHVGISIKTVKNYTGIGTLTELNNILMSYGIPLLDDGHIKTSKDHLLKQSATMSGGISMCFRIDDFGVGDFEELKTLSVPGGFVEFVDRQRDGFEAENAIDIFESTNLKD